MESRWFEGLGQGVALLAVGAIGALAGWAAGIPAGMLVGALLTSGIYRLAVGERLATSRLEPWRAVPDTLT